MRFRKTGFMEFYGGLDNLRTLEFPAFPSFATAQIKKILHEKSEYFTDIPLMKEILSEPDFFRIIYGNVEKKEIIEKKFEKIQNRYKIQEIDNLFFCYNYSKENENIESLLKYLKLKNENLNIYAIALLYAIALFSRLNNRVKLVEEGIIQFQD